MDDVVAFFGDSISDKLSRIIRDVTNFLLLHQYISRRGDPRWFRVVVGTGMGLIHSSEIAEAAFYSRTERWSSLPGPRSSFRINWHYQFKDDIRVLQQYAIVSVVASTYTDSLPLFPYRG